MMISLDSVSTALAALHFFIQIIVVSACESGDVRLTGGTDNTSGRVEFCHEGHWGTICEDDWDEEDALVVCRQLGLPTGMVSAVQGFGGGTGDVFLDNVDCNGTENQLADCNYNGIGIDHCKEFNHVEDAGVACFSDDGTLCNFEQSMLHENPTKCDDHLITPEPSKACVHRYGACVPFYPMDTPTLCDDLYEQGVDYIFVPSSRRDGVYSKLIKDIREYGPFLLEYFKRCYEPVRRMLCHFYLPTCGNATTFKPPSVVCPEFCHKISQLCPDEWANFIRGIASYNFILEVEGLQLIDCNQPGLHLLPLPHCCSNYGIDLSSFEGTEPKSDSTLSVVYTAVGSVTALLFILAFLTTLAVLLRCCYRRRHRMVISTPNTFYRQHTRVTIRGSINNMAENHTSQAHITTNLYTSNEFEVDRKPRVMSAFIRKMSEDQLLIPEESISMSSIIGQGEFGIVFRGSLSNWKDIHKSVAIKTLKGEFTSSDLRQLVEESQIMVRFNHPNVMKLLGVAISKSKTLLVVMPFMAQGSLLAYLKRKRAELTVENEELTDLIKTTSSALLSKCLQIARGMEYLASKKFIHRDLATRNCMIDNEGMIKVADFGLSEDIYARNYFKQARDTEDVEAAVKLPVKWMALESLNDGIFSEKTDIWSFGVTCWEVFSLGKRPYPGVGPFSLIRYLERGDRLDKPLNLACSQEIYELMKKCWHVAPEKRPTFSQLVTDISTRLEGICGYLDLMFTPA